MSVSRTAVYLSAKVDIASGSLSLLSSTLKAMLVVGSYVPDFENDTTLADIPAPSRATSGVLLTGKVLQTTGNTVRFQSATVTFNSVPSGPEVTGVVLYEDTGTEGTSRLVGHFDYFSNFPLTPNGANIVINWPIYGCLLYTSPSPRDGATSRMPSSA